MARKPTDDDQELDMPLLLAEHRLDGVYQPGVDDDEDSVLTKSFTEACVNTVLNNLYSLRQWDVQHVFYYEPDAMILAHLNPKFDYDRIGYESLFDVYTPAHYEHYFNIREFLEEEYHDYYDFFKNNSFVKQILFFQDYDMFQSIKRNKSSEEQKKSLTPLEEAIKEPGFINIKLQENVSIGFMTLTDVAESNKKLYKRH